MEDLIVLLVLAFLIFLISTLKKTTGGKIKGLRGETTKNWGVTLPSWGETKGRLGENPPLPGERVINKRTRTVKALSPNIGNKFSKKKDVPYRKGTSLPYSLLEVLYICFIPY
jgi:hypothetical protein